MSLRFVSAAADVSRETPGILGGARLGGGPLDDDRAWPMQAIPAPLLASTAGTIEEYWLATGQLRSGEANGLRWQRNDEVLFGVITLNEADYSEAAEAAGKTALQLASEAAYARIFELIDREGLPKLWRIWNYLADINQEVGEANGLERYRQFNIGRQDAFLASQRCATGNVPAACAIGLGRCRLPFSPAPARRCRSRIHVRSAPIITRRPTDRAARPSRAARWCIRPGRKSSSFPAPQASSAIRRCTRLTRKDSAARPWKTSQP